MAALPSLTTRMTSVSRLRDASATTNSSAGVLTIGSSSLGTTFVIGRNRVPRPAAGIKALVTRSRGMPGRLTRWDRARRASYGRGCSRRGRRWVRRGSATLARWCVRTSWPGSGELLDELVSRGVAVIVPLLLDDRDLDWAPWPSGDVLGLGAIADVDVILVP